MLEVMTPPPSAPLRRRNSIATSVVVPTNLSLPTKLHHHPSSLPTTYATSTTNSISSSSSSSQAFPAVDFELISIKPFSYTSLKDLLPSTAVQSPTSAGGQSGYEISIRNRLVKQAAWAYLQPMSTSPDSSGGSLLHGLWVKFSGALVKNPVAALIRFVGCRIIRTLKRTVDRLLRGIRIRSPRW